MKSLDVGQLFCVGAILVLVEAANRRQIDSESKWLARSWPSRNPNYRNEFTQDSDYNRVSNTAILDDYDYGADDRLTDEAAVDLLYSRSARPRALLNLDHPSLSERTTYTSLYYPNMETRPSTQFQDIFREASSNFPVISTYSHSIIH